MHSFIRPLSISSFFSPSLKTEPGVLHSLLSYLVSSPCTNVTFKLLSVIDSMLEDMDYGLLAKLIAQARDSEILRLSPSCHIVYASG